MNKEETEDVGMTSEVPSPLVQKKWDVRSVLCICRYFIDVPTYFF